MVVSLHISRLFMCIPLQYLYMTLGGLPSRFGNTDIQLSDVISLFISSSSALKSNFFYGRTLRLSKKIERYPRQCWAVHAFICSMLKYHNSYQISYQASRNAENMRCPLPVVQSKWISISFILRILIISNTQQNLTDHFKIMDTDYEVALSTFETVGAF